MEPVPTSQLQLNTCCTGPESNKPGEQPPALHPIQPLYLPIQHPAQLALST